jgi:uncharacterized pyridoxamine 5'-phosphate oxidase family protein
LHPNDKIKPVEQGSELLSEIKFIPLKEEDQYVIAHVNKLIRCDSFFYLWDRKTQTIYKYDTEGNPAKFFHQVGGSLNEYIEIVDFDIDTENKEINILCLPPKILYTDMDFNVKKAVDLDGKNFNRIASWKNTAFLYNHTRRVVYSINQGEKLKECFSTTEMQGDLIDASPAFFKTQQALYFQSPGDDCIYKITENEFVPYITLDYDNKQSAITLHNKNVLEITFEERLKYPVPYIKNIIEKDNQLILFYVHGMIYRMCTYDISQNTYNDQILISFLVFPGCFYNNTLYGIEYPYNIARQSKITEYKDFMRNFMSGVKYDLDENMSLDKGNENPIIVEQILK